MARLLAMILETKTNAKSGCFASDAMPISTFGISMQDMMPSLMGTCQMANDPKRSVVDRNIARMMCRIC